MANWLTSLKTDTPQEGYELAIEMAKRGVAYMQPSLDTRKAAWSVYTEKGESLMFGSLVIATHFQTIAKANGYWPDKDILLEGAKD